MKNIVIINTSEIFAILAIAASEQLAHLIAETHAYVTYKTSVYGLCGMSIVSKAELLQLGGAYYLEDFLSGIIAD